MWDRQILILRWVGSVLGCVFHPLPFLAFPIATLGDWSILLYGMFRIAHGVRTP